MKCPTLIPTLTCIRVKLFGGTVPPPKKLFEGTVPLNNFFLPEARSWKFHFSKEKVIYQMKNLGIRLWRFTLESEVVAALTVQGRLAKNKESLPP